MPRLTIDILEGRSMEQKRALAKGLCEAITESFQLPLQEGMVRIIEIRFEDFAQGGEFRSDASLREGKLKYGDVLEPRIYVQFLEGYSHEMKQKLVKRITEVAAPVLGVTDNDVRIFLQEIPSDSFAVAGILACDESASRT